MPSDRDYNGPEFPIQRVKIVLGEPGVDDGDVSEDNPLPTTGGGGGGSSIVDIDEDNVSSGAYGGTVVGTSAVQVIVGSTVTKKGVLIKTNEDNAGSVYVGLSSSVTADAGGTNSGIRLKAGASIFIPIDNANKIYMIASQASQNVAWIAC